MDAKILKTFAKHAGKKQFENNWEVEKRKPHVELVEPDPFLEKVSRKPLALAKTFLKKNEDKSK